ncbi:methyltransferase domain-containing protein [uncultured Jatrophihabitans sp.]|uniref:methyltransferase domain-containing protein n=1 Tax=uncultured Jatrophihabitans sp. TaxID=1610747 RepID=UPI0035CA7854
MRQVIGKRTLDLDAADFAALRAPYERLVVDLGTGDGKHVLAVARAHPDTLVVGVDASPDAMRKTAFRAAQKPARGGTPNAMFVWASAEQLPPELDGIDELHALMPWGSLLRTLTLTEQSNALLSVGERCRTGATFLITLNLHAWRPPVPEVGDAPEPTPDSARTDLAVEYEKAGWHLDDVHYADDAELAAYGTSWTKRLGSTRDELAVLTLRWTINRGTDGSTRRAPSTSR